MPQRLRKVVKVFQPRGDVVRSELVRDETTTDRGSATRSDVKGRVR